MPSFPTSVFAPTTKTTGQTIQPAHINDVQDELVAVEGALINGPLNLASSTFAARPVMPPPDVVRLQLDASLQLATGSTTAVAWTNQAIITNSSMHSTGTNPTRITPQSTGVYWCHAQIGFNYSSAGSLEIVVEDSSGGIIAYALNRSTANSGPAICAAGPKRFDALGGYVRVVVTGAGSTNSVATNITHFSMWKM